jgi:uncharacterized GH25 family protein
MRKFLASLALLVALTTLAQAHFVFLLPQPDGKVHAVFSDDLEPDNEKLLAKIKHSQFGIVAGDKLAKRTATQKGDVLEIAETGNAPAWIQAVCPYGVLTKGDNTFFLAYYARGLANHKLPRSLKTAYSSTAISTLKLDVVLKLETEAEPRALVLWNGKALAGAEVILYVPGKKGTVEATSDAQGYVSLPAAEANGIYGIRARHIVKEPGKYDGKDYPETRAYTTVTFLVSDVRKTSVEGE